MTVLARIRGRVAEKHADSLIIFAGGLGFEVQAPRSTIAALPEIGEETTLRTYLHIREGALGLFGFVTEGEQQLFELLLTVSGVGPRAALNCLSLLNPEQLAGAIAAGNVAEIVRVPGVGRKTAERIVMELKGKVANLPQETPTGGTAGNAGVREALVSMGYTASEAEAAIAHIPTDRILSEQERILHALRYFASA
jgi:Holliday junction DNA helicase RuvA